MTTKKQVKEELPGSFWRRVYLAVIATTFIVVSLLWAFGRYFG
ncbi:MAG: hypothetical protein AB7J13_01055 [Pyrinomonadaceae bacterium]